MQQLSSVEGSAPTCTLLPLSSTLLPSTPYGTTAMRFIVVEKEDQMSDVIINPQKISTVVRSDEKAMFCTSFGSNFDLHIVLEQTNNGERHARGVPLHQAARGGVRGGPGDLPDDLVARGLTDGAVLAVSNHGWG